MKFHELWAEHNITFTTERGYTLWLDRYVRLSIRLHGDKKCVKVYLEVEDLYKTIMRDETTLYKEGDYRHANGLVSVADPHQAINMVEDVYEECFDTFCSLLKLEIKQ